MFQSEDEFRVMKNEKSSLYNFNMQENAEKKESYNASDTLRTILLWSAIGFSTALGATYFITGIAMGLTIGVTSTLIAICLPLATEHFCSKCLKNKISKPRKKTAVAAFLTASLITSSLFNFAYKHEDTGFKKYMQDSLIETDTNIKKWFNNNSYNKNDNAHITDNSQRNDSNFKISNFIGNRF